MGLETFFTPSEQTMFFLYSVLMGACIGIFFDFFRVARLIVTHTTFFVALEDIIFVFIWAVALIVFSMELCRGEVRFYYFIGNILGFTLYFFTVGKIVVGAIRAIVMAIYKVFHFIYKIIFKPIIKIIVSACQILLHAFVTIYSKFKLFINHAKISLKDKHKMMYNKSTHKKSLKKQNKEVNRVGKSKRKKIKAKKTKEKHHST